MQKTVQGVVTKYTLHGKNVVHMTQGRNELHFFYDAANKPAVVIYNGTAYAYAKNLQGDIIAILDQSGNVVVQYAYDAWGKPIGKTGTLASTLGTVQPFRYRGYVYDEETGLYYLRSRYYNPVWCRFVNADVLYDDGTKPIFHNLFVYAGDSPVVRVDSEGRADQDCYDEDGITGPLNDLTGSPMNGGHPSSNSGSSSTTPLYRWIGTNPGNLTPSVRDIQANTTSPSKPGFSFSSISKPGCGETTVEAIEGTGVLRVVQDSPTHFSVFPVNNTLSGWHEAGRNSIWTTALKAVIHPWGR